MSLTIDPAAASVIRLTDVNGHVVMDSASSLFHVTDTLQGTTTLPSWTNPPHNGGVDVSIGACHPDSTFLRVAVRVTYTGSALGMFPQSGWFILSTSFVQIANAHAVRFFSFDVAAGAITLRDRVYTRLITNEFGQVLSGLPSITLQYHIFAGRFTP